MVAVVVRVEAGADHGLGGVLLNVSVVPEGANETLGQSFNHAQGNLLWIDRSLI